MQHTIRDIHEAENQLKEAQITLKTMLEAVWPKGTVLKVKKGRAIFTVRVEGFGSYWANPGQIHGTNVLTGKTRTFHHSHVIQH